MKISKRCRCARRRSLAMGVSMAVPLALPAGAAKSTVSCTKLTALAAADGRQDHVHGLVVHAGRAQGRRVVGDDGQEGPDRRHRDADDHVEERQGHDGRGPSSTARRTKGKCKAPYDSRGEDHRHRQAARPARRPRSSRRASRSPVRLRGHEGRQAGSVGARARHDVQAVRVLTVCACGPGRRPPSRGRVHNHRGRAGRRRVA